jgi:hypothetical protein
MAKKTIAGWTSVKNKDDLFIKLIISLYIIFIHYISYFS